MPFEKKDDNKKSRVLSARLSPEKPHEKAALRVWDDLLAKGLKPRQIMTDSLLFATDHTPDMFDDVHAEQDALSRLNAKLDDLQGLDERIQSMMENMFRDMLVNLKRANPDALRNFVNSSVDEESITLGNINVSDAFAENTQRTARKTFKQRQRDER